MWLAPDGNSVLYILCLSPICLFQRDCAAPLQEVLTKAPANRQKKSPNCHCLALCVNQQWEDGEGDAEVGFYSVSATVKLVSCVNATVHINQPKYTDDQGFSSILFGRSLFEGEGWPLHQLRRISFIQYVDR